MGSTITNLEHLLRMPYGCGEQNMLNFAPNIYVMDYLSATGQLTTALSERAITNMEAGQCGLYAITGLTSAAVVCPCMFHVHIDNQFSWCQVWSSQDEVAEWLRRWTANPLGSARVGSNPILVV